MTEVFLGGDSAIPKPDRVEGKRIWGVYVAGDTFHVWTKEEVASLKDGGIEGILPIVVPSQSESWWLANGGYAALEELVRDALTWGVPEGSPLCLDVEEHQAEAIGNSRSEVARAWAVACRAHKLIPWVYSGQLFLATDQWSNKWLAEWPDVTPENPELPAGMKAWQYHGEDDGIDLDIFSAEETYLSPELKVAPEETSESEETVSSETEVAEPAKSPETGNSDVASTEPDAVALLITDVKGQLVCVYSALAEARAAVVELELLIEKLETDAEVPKS